MVLKQFAQFTPTYPALVHTVELYLDSFWVNRTKRLAPGARLMCSSHRGTFVERPIPELLLGRSPETYITWTLSPRQPPFCSIKSLLDHVDLASEK